MNKKHNIKGLRNLTPEQRADWLSHAESVTGSHYWMDDDVQAELQAAYRPTKSTRKPCTGCRGL